MREKDCKSAPLISVIIPAYNAQRTIDDCVHSVQAQTFQNFEILIVNDGSGDGTLDCIERLAALDERIRFFDSENKGQGIQRNFAMRKANGMYILFLDADDFLEPYTLELTLNRAVEDGSDLVFFNWKYYNDKTRRYSFTNKERFADKNLLCGDECLMLLSSKAYYSVTRLYKKSFLSDNGIFYGEGYIYEDLVFIVKCAVKAKRVSVIDSPLYCVRTHPASTTRTNLSTDRHYKGFMRAGADCFDILRETDNAAKHYFYSYIYGRYFAYYASRIPKNMRKSFTVDFLTLLSKEDIKPVPFKGELSLRFLLMFYVIRKKSLMLLFFLNLYYQKACPRIRKIKKKVNRHKSRLTSFIKRFWGRVKPRSDSIDKNVHLPAYRSALKEELGRKTVLFLGFDFRYTGNSRYLYEQVLEAKTDEVAVYFATYSEDVQKEHKLTPYSKAFYNVLATANILVFESWTNPAFVKRADALWIQLWHGTPLKKMLFDSNEGDIVRKNPDHKLQKFTDIGRWDIFVTDHPNVNRFFETSFLLSDKKLLPCGYPRVRFLSDNRFNAAMKSDIKAKLHIPTDKKIVVYLPTWRDYNYTPGQEDTAYLLDVPALKGKLNDDYFLIDKNHTFLSDRVSVNFSDFKNAETQELLLIADCLITDYSSVMFDAFAVDIPVVLYVNDFEKYQASRGVYPALWNTLTDFICEDTDAVAAKVKQYPSTESYGFVKSEYCFSNRANSLLPILFNHLAHGANRRNTLVVIETGKYDTALGCLLLASDRHSDTMTAAVLQSSDTPYNTAEFENLVLSSGYVDAVIHPAIKDLPTLVSQRNIFTVVTTEDLCPAIYASLSPLCRVMVFDKKENRLKDGFLK